MCLYKIAKKGLMKQYNTVISSAILAFMLLAFFQGRAIAQGSAGSKAKMPRLSVVDMPTARILPTRAYRVSGLLMQESGVLTHFTYGLTKNVNLGFSYSSMPLFGEGDPTLQPLLLFEVRARLYAETKKRPALAIGINSQGIGAWRDIRRFDYNAPGVYAVASKNINWEAGVMSLHAGVNYPVMPAAYSKTPSAFLGIEQSFYKNVTLSAEYAGTWNEDPKYMNKNGLLNCAVKYSPFKGVTMFIQGRDLLESRANATGFLRYAGIEYIGVF